MTTDDKIIKVLEELKELKQQVARQQGCKTCAFINRFSCGWTEYECSIYDGFSKWGQPDAAEPQRGEPVTA